MEIILSPNPETINTSTSGFLRALFARCQRALFEPARFFRHDLPQMSLSEALAFGIGNAWGASVLAFFVQTINTLLVGQLLERWMQRLVASEEGFALWGLSAQQFLYSSAALLLAPFLLLARTFFVTFWLYLFARLLIEDRPGAPEPVTFRGAFRVQAAVLTGRWFSVVPVFGGFLSFVVCLVLTVTGVRERFGVSTRRAIAVVLAPYFLLFLLALTLAVLLIFGLTQLPFEELLQMEGGGQFDW
jgi:hypothetical protein